MRYFSRIIIHFNENSIDISIIINFITSVRLRLRLFLIVIHFNDRKYETSLNNFQLFLLKILSSRPTRIICDNNTDK